MRPCTKSTTAPSKLSALVGSANTWKPPASNTRSDSWRSSGLTSHSFCSARVPARRSALTPWAFWASRKLRMRSRAVSVKFRFISASMPLDGQDSEYLHDVFVGRALEAREVRDVHAPGAGQRAVVAELTENPGDRHP